MTDFRDRLLQPGGAYCYVVTAYDTTGLFSVPSAETCAQVPAEPPVRGCPLTGAVLRLVDNTSR